MNVVHSKWAETLDFNISASSPVNPNVINSSFDVFNTFSTVVKCSAEKKMKAIVVIQAIYQTSRHLNVELTLRQYVLNFFRKIQRKL